jgi:WD40 repeat protein
MKRISKSRIIHLISLTMLFVLLFTAACQANEPQNQTNSSEPDSFVSDDTADTSEKTVSEETTETKQPEQDSEPTEEPTPTSDPEPLLNITGSEPITADNVNQIVELARLGKGDITDIEYLPDGKTISIVTGVGIYLYDSETLKELDVFARDIGAKRVDYSPDGKKAAISVGSETIQIWDVALNEKISVLEGHEKGVRRCLFSPDGKYIITSSVDKTIRIWDAETGAELNRYESDEDLGYDLDYSPDGTKLLFTSNDSLLIMIDPLTGEEISSLDLGEEYISNLQFSPDGTKIIGSDFDGLITIWDAETGETIRQLEGHTDNIWSISYSPDGSMIASSSDDNTFRLWSAETGSELFMVEESEFYIFQIAYSPDGKSILIRTYDGLIKIRDGISGELLAEIKDFTESPWKVTYSPTGKTLAAVCFNGFEIRDAQTWQLLKRWDKKETGGYFIGFSGDGSRIAVKDEDAIKILDAESLTEISSFELPVSDIFRASISPDGNQVAFSAGDYPSYTLWIWDSVSSDFKKLADQPAFISALTFSPDGSVFVSVYDGAIRLLDTVTFEEIKSIDGYYNADGVVFSPDGSEIYISQHGGGVVVIDVESGKEARPITVKKLEGYSYSVPDVVFSKDGSFFVVGGYNVMQLFDTKTAEELLTIESHKGLMNAVDISPDGKTMVSNGFDGLIRFWGIP